ncbi:MAG: SpoIIIAH-like family protein [Clostridium sp.]|nr:SpoIIIAH-like family protein [Clostridium sp.]MCM1444329.1 SpoIIIAH-like family protein [Candidatus Amulumruptor caecigallinarius]
MINKRSIWFLTLFCLILVLSVYYVTMPSELLLSANSNYTNTNNKNEANPTVKVEESTILTSLRVESDEQMMNEIGALQTVLTSKDASVEEKNTAYEKIKQLNLNKGEEQQIENQIQTTYNLKSFVKVNGNQVRVVIAGAEHDSSLANNIMRTVQSNYENEMYVSVKFQQ